MTLLLTLSLGIGFLLGLLGGGGSILTVPMLVYLFDVPPKSAVLTSFTVVGVSSMVAVIKYATRKRVCWKNGLFFGLSGMCGSFLGGKVGAVLPDRVLMTLFGVLALATGIVMLVKGGTARNGTEENLPCPPRTAYARVLFDGFWVGVITGMVGVGAGFLIVPVLTMLVGLPMPAAIGTSLMVLTMNALAGFAGHFAPENLNLELMLTVSAATLIGSGLGAQFSAHVGGAMLRRLFGVFIVGVSGYILYRTVNKEIYLDATRMLHSHIEFFLGGASLAVLCVLLRFGAWIHAISGHAPALLPEKEHGGDECVSMTRRDAHA
ncbi:sulfite exporter TauE/SafE family protein [Candidatus Methylospira mobilis]|uniref:Probable membrane transporter protein n=1 Tax=Candidatus Methylospira mobilis TaxID=1808979 RepID=A0A5Q0BF75_9GAMM|nr:sulfite exporter TauE/SafE family protein [Candidatus Methylospira mobilis]QFY41782.1 sulfite exporter TauE/SafE family protein [Candidatus Methylospira mobilis]